MATPASGMVADTDEHVLTPKNLIEAHRMKNLAASPGGKHAAFGLDRYSFAKKEMGKRLYVMGTDGGEPAVLSTLTNKGVWLSEDELLYLDDKTNTLFAKHVDEAVQGVAYSNDLSDHEQGAHLKKHGNHVGIFPTKVESMRIVSHGSDAATLVFSAQVYADGDLTKVPEHEKSEEVAVWDEVKVYEEGFARHWDVWLYPGRRSQLFSVDLKRHGSKAQWAFASHFRNLLSGTKLQAPVAPFGDEGDYHVSEEHVIFTARDPAVNPAWHTRQNIYLAALKGDKKLQTLTSGKQGATSSPAFSPKGQHVVWLQMEIDGFEADRNRIIMQHLPTGTTKSILPDWQLSPASIQFSRDGKSLVGFVEKDGQKHAFTIELHRGSSDAGDALTTLTEHEVVLHSASGSVSALAPLSSGDILAMQSSYQAANEVMLISTQSSGKSKQLTAFGKAKESSLANVDMGPLPEHFTYKGANGRDAYGWLLKPPGYSDDKTYPLLTLVHGGPESAWTNSWGTRWNAAAFAAQGFVAIALNPAGSTGYGQAYQEEILHQLGGAPFEDVVAGTRYMLDTLKNLDPARSVAAGASYGGYMMNWINGHNDDGLYKGLVCHDGIYSTVGMVAATEELYFPFHEMGGPMWGPARETYDKWSPDRFADKWRTPTLVIHGGQDFRLTESEGISVYNTLQNLGIPTRFLYFPKESHWVNNPKNSLRWHNEVFAWLHKYSAGQDRSSESISSTRKDAAVIFQQS